MEVRVLGEVEEVIGVGIDREVQKAWIRVRCQGSPDALQLNLPIRQLIQLSAKMIEVTQEIIDSIEGDSQ